MIQRFCASLLAGARRHRARGASPSRRHQPPPIRPPWRPSSIGPAPPRAANGAKPSSSSAAIRAAPTAPTTRRSRPTRVFDNLYALGRTSTVVWALTTPDGILLIDAGYPDQLESRAAAAGCAPPGSTRTTCATCSSGTATPITSAALRISRQRGARVALSAADWDLIENPPPPPAGAPPRPPPRRLAAAAPRRRRGRRRADRVRRRRDHARADPGHTPGALGFVFRRAGRRHARTPRRCSAARSCSSTGSPDDGLRQYVQSLEHFARRHAAARRRRRDPESPALRRVRDEARRLAAARLPASHIRSSSARTRISAS